MADLSYFFFEILYFLDRNVKADLFKNGILPFLNKLSFVVVDVYVYMYNMCYHTSGCILEISICYNEWISADSFLIQFVVDHL